jgi:hypothetical protein
VELRRCRSAAVSGYASKGLCHLRAIFVRHRVSLLDDDPAFSRSSAVLALRCHNRSVIAELLDELAHDIPDLHGAACRGHPELFDVADRHDRQGTAQAKALCA